MNRFIKKITTSTIAVMLMIGVVIPAEQAQAATTAELQAMINAFMAHIAEQQSAAVSKPNPVGVPAGKAGGVAAKFASFVQADSRIEVGSTGHLLTGKVKPAKYDRNLNKVVMYVSPSAVNDVKEPWVAFDEVELVVNGYGVRSVDVNEPARWTKVSTQNGVLVYAVTVYEGNIKLPAKSAHTFGATAEVSEGGNGDTWKMWIPKNGITTWSQQTAHVSYGPSRSFEYELVVGEDDTNVAALVQLLDKGTEVVVTEGNGRYGKFTFDFEVVANDTDLYLPTTSNGLAYVDRPMSEDSFLNFSISDGNGKVLNGYGLEGYAVSVESSARRVGTGEGIVYLVEEGEVENFTVTVTYQPKVTGAYSVSLEGPLRYSPDSTFHDANDGTVNFNEKDFRSATVHLMATSAVKYEVNLYSPAEAQTYKTGDTIIVEWKTSNLNDQVANITLFGNNTERHIVKNVPLSTGRAVYKIPASDSLGKIVDGTYKLSIWVTGVKDGDVRAMSDSVDIKIVNGAVLDPVIRPIINSFVVNPVTVSGGQKVTFTWSSKNSDVCYITLPDTPAETALFGLQGSSGTVAYVPEWKSGVTKLLYTLTCVDDVSKSTPTKAQSTVVVSQLATDSTPKATTTPEVKPTPRFNGIEYPVGTPKVTVSAVFAAPTVAKGATGPINLGQVAWGDGSSGEQVFGLVTGSQITVQLKHIYNKPGKYKITLVGLDGKTVSKNVTATFPISNVSSSSVPVTAGAVLGASIDVYSQMSAILVGIQEVINLMK